MAFALANRYARALVDVVMAPGSALKPEDAVKQLRDVDALFEESADLRNAMLTPAIQNSRKRAVLAKLLAREGSSPLIRNFTYVLLDHRRIGIVGEIREAFERQVDERLGFARAEVVSAVALDESSTASLASELSRVTGRRMRLNFRIDPALIGGVVARIGSTVYDGSVRGELRDLGKKLAGQPG
ncbi:MAG TPA: ATP synthase F1 subunit delta [Bryobacteraceae bacterium]|nr:ATP synthase F1 subunit delta [Bryobacteraceae bacterium]